VKLRTVLFTAALTVTASTPALAQYRVNPNGGWLPQPAPYQQQQVPQPSFVPNPAYNFQPNRQYVPNYGAPGMPEVGGGLVAPHNGIGGGYTAPNYGEDEQ